MGVSLHIVLEGMFVGFSAVNVWCRSANASNSNNFCNVNTDGTANNNNANYSIALAPIS